MATPSKTKGESAREKFGSLYADDETAEEGDPEAGVEDEGDGDVSECIADIEEALARLKSKVGK